MAAFCAGSAKLTLPTLLQSICRSESPLIRESKRLVPLRAVHRPRHRLYQGKRPFSSISRLLLSRSESQLSSQDETPADAENSTQPHTTTDGKNQVKKSAVKTGLQTSKTTKKAKPSSSPVEKKPSDFSKRPPREKKHTQSDRRTKPKMKKEPWQIQKAALKRKFKEGWNPSKKLSPDAIEGIRNLHAVAPDRFTTPILAEQFEVSPEAIRRILRSKWRPSEDEMEDRRRRWEKRHDRIWSHLSELGLRPKNETTEALADVNILYDKQNKGKGEA
ncbi:hypothetical protein BDV25DRAFT_156504 [Aspergillus avenaceus]|uniref:Required for respiratory growth protein 9, mitochondrial n=1 Tax=Aspergillus avenaceus TaxID=36643 RepID=A0A5N6TSP9_ASPAV|nr:hypothetical protein BDV25DRAFT_156504 [Aspergillus avenaceus]